MCATLRTTNFDPGGFAEYVRVMPHIVNRGVVRIPDHVRFEEATFVEPVNTCLKAVVQCDPQPDDVVLVQGQGPIGLLFTMLLKLRGCTIVTTDTIAARLSAHDIPGAKTAIDAMVSLIQHANDAGTQIVDDNNHDPSCYLLAALEYMKSHL